MSQHDMTIANQTASAARTDLNNALQALASTNSGGSAPSPTFANQLWYDTTSNILKVRNEANSAWCNLLYVDQTSNVGRVLDDTLVVNTGGTQTGLLGDQSTATWQAGSGTTQSLVSPANVAAAIAALAPLGLGISQSWGSYARSSGTSYQNTTGKPIMIAVRAVGNDAQGLQVSSDNSTWYGNGIIGIQGTHYDDAWAVVPNGHYYRLSGANTVAYWHELR